MIKFFRKIRQKLLFENPPSVRTGKLSKYFTYAIGEIVLVVIGILIALQINNNNEAKNNKNRYLKILKEIRQDLETDLTTTSRLLVDGKRSDSLMNLVLNEKLTRDDYLNNEKFALFWVGLYFNQFDYQKTAFRKLENFQGIIPEELDSLTNLINKHYNITGKFYDDIYALEREQIQDRHDHLASNFSWYHVFMNRKTSEEMVDFYLDDPIYKNWIAQHKLTNSTSPGGVVARLEGSSFLLFLEINNYLDDNYQLENKTLLKKYGKPIHNKKDEWIGSYTLGNNSDYTIENRGGYLYGFSRFLLKVNKDTLVDVNSNTNIVVSKRDSKGTLIGIKMINTQDSTKGRLATKIKDD